jgi:hypothetical protein
MSAGATPRHDETHGHEPVPILRRVYALVPIVAVLYLSFMAFRYLYVQLFIPWQTPVQVAAIRTRLTEEVWRTRPEEFVGTQLAEYPRAPLAHYHHIDGWFQPDQVNDCTRSGCHAPMPHAEHKEVRAFLNMHATSLHCGVCHMDAAPPRPLVWYDLETGAPTESPALLAVYGWLESARGVTLREAPTQAAQEELVGLLRKAARQAGGDPAIEELADRVAGPRWTSAAFQEAIAHVRERLPLHFRGEYGAKLALRGADGRPILGHPNSAAAVQEYLTQRETLSGAERDAVLERVHTARSPQTLNCTECHVAEGSLLDLESVGYPPEREAALHRGWIFQAIEHILAGQPLHLPGFITPDNGSAAPTATAPVEEGR